MKRWLSSLITLGVGVCIGVLTGYGVAVLKAATSSVLVTAPRGGEFQRVYTDMGKLNALEMLSSNCSGVSDIRPTLSKEADVVRNLRTTENASASAATIDLADSRLAIRAAMVAEAAKDTKTQLEQESRAQKLLESAGWRDPSAARMRRIISELDQDRCGRSSTNTEGVR
jgi:hypothetical protein